MLNNDSGVEFEDKGNNKTVELNAFGFLNINSITFNQIYKKVLKYFFIQNESTNNKSFLC